MPPAPVDRRRIFVREYLGLGRARWGCFAADHTWVDFVLKKRHREKGGLAGSQLMARWWRRESGGVSGRCPRCAKKKTPTV